MHPTVHVFGVFQKEIARWDRHVRKHFDDATIFDRPVQIRYGTKVVEIDSIGRCVAHYRCIRSSRHNIAEALFAASQDGSLRGLVHHCHVWTVGTSGFPNDYAREVTIVLPAVDHVVGADQCVCCGA